MQRTLSTSVLLALLASGLFLGAHTALADERESVILTYEVGTAIEPGTLPEVTGGTPPFTYSLVPALPVGLTFDAATRTISGTPLVVTPATEHTYIVTDGANASASLPFSIEVVLPPLEAVQSLRVLDAPNDQGSRIVLTWTLSPSDRLLQGVVAGAVGPAEPVVGVYGYNIYRRAVGEDEFVLIAQVDAGVTSFVDETALNGVRYTYQVRPYNLDNETGSDIEQTAMAVRNLAVDSEGRMIFGLFGTDNRIGFDDFFIFADTFGLTAEDAGFDPAFDLAPSAQIDFEDFFVFADNFGRSTAAAGKRVPMLAGLNADARLYLDARTALPSVGEDFVLDVRLADFAAIKGYGLQVQYEADKLEFVEVLTDQPLGGSALAAPQVLSDEAGKCWRWPPLGMSSRRRVGAELGVPSDDGDRAYGH